MTKEDALTLLENAPQDGQPSRVNPALTRYQAVQIVYNYVVSLKDSEVLADIFERRVCQVALDQPPYPTY
jgi:hypothetical protein